MSYIDQIGEALNGDCDGAEIAGIVQKAVNAMGAKIIPVINSAAPGDRVFMAAALSLLGNALYERMIPEEKACVDMMKEKLAVISWMGFTEQ